MLTHIKPEEEGNAKETAAAAPILPEKRERLRSRVESAYEQMTMNLLVSYTPNVQQLKASHLAAWSGHRCEKMPPLDEISIPSLFLDMLAREEDPNSILEISDMTFRAENDKMVIVEVPVDENGVIEDVPAAQASQQPQAESSKSATDK